MSEAPDAVKLLVEPDDGIAALLRQIEQARESVDTTIFRFDLAEVERALAAAVARGVRVRALIARTNGGGEKLLRKLELRLLDAGVILARSDDTLVRYHGKLLIADGAALTLMLFNYTRLDTFKSRSFAIVTRDAATVQDALSLFESDMTRQPYTPAHARLVVSPENSRQELAAFIKAANAQLLVYDPKVSDRLMLRLIEERARQGVEVRILGKVGKHAKTVTAEKLCGLRLHARVIVRDGRDAFLGSQSLRKLELDHRREVGIIVDDRTVVSRLVAVFEADWAAATAPKPAADEEAAAAASSQ